LLISCVYFTVLLNDAISGLKNLANMPINHLGITVPADRFEEIVEWYKKSLTPIKYTEQARYPGAVGLGADGVPDFWLTAKEDFSKQDLHIAFTSPGERLLMN
jgi:hypothetical protein